MVRRNILANYIGRTWVVVSVYIFVPLYLKFLGIEAYGLIGFYSTLLGVLALADMGLTATLSREMARLEAREGAAGEMGDLLRTYESIYLGISLGLAAAIWFAAPSIAGRWLQAGALPLGEIASAIKLMGIAIALQLPANLYSGGLFGLQRQVMANSLMIGWGIFRGVGSVLVLWLVSPTIIAFSLWQIVSNAAYLFAVRFGIRHVLPAARSKPGFKRTILRNTWRYASGLAGLTLFSTILKQSDKLAVSKLLPLEIFGYYTLAGSLAMAPVLLAGPIALAVFPRLIGLASAGDGGSLRRIYHRSCSLVSIAAFPATLTLALYAGRFIYAWTGSAAAGDKVGTVASLLLIGQAMQAVTVVPYHLALAHGDTRLNLRIGLASVVFIAPLLIFSIPKLGVIGGAISWLVMNVCTLPPYMYFLHRRFLPGEFRGWILHDVGRPLLASLPVVILAFFLMPFSPVRLITFGQICLVWGLSAVSATLAMPEFRDELILRTKGLLGLS